jgi:hypothetical protein
MLERGDVAARPTGLSTCQIILSQQARANTQLLKPKKHITIDGRGLRVLTLGGSPIHVDGWPWEINPTSL